MNTKAYDTFVVTGGAGFVGSYLIEKLLQSYPQTKIISLDNYFTGLTSNHVADERVTYIVGDTQNMCEIWREQNLPRADAVFHLGEYSRIWQSFEDFDRVWDYNMRGTKEVVKYCHLNTCKLIYAGSSSKFGNEGLDQHLSPYSWIKAKNIEFVINFSDWFGLDYVVTYFYNVYGPRHIKKGKYATVVGIFETLYEEGKPLTVRYPGAQTRDFTHVEDIVEGIILCFEKGQGDGYQIGTGREYSLIELAKMFSDNYIITVPEKGERLHGKADLTKIRSLGWQPKHSLEDYVEEFKRRV
jgi:UDP-glucose 4-epimerase